MRKEYLVDTLFGDLATLQEKELEFGKGLKQIRISYRGMYDSKIRLDVVTSIDFINSRIKLLPLQVGLPQEMKAAILELFTKTWSNS